MAFHELQMILNFILVISGTNVSKFVYAYSKLFTEHKNLFMSGYKDASIAGCLLLKMKS